MKFFIALLFGGLVSILSVQPADAASRPFQAWLADIRQEAVRQGISPSLVNKVLHHDLRPIPRIIELDRKQPEGKITFAQYRRNIVNDARIRKGRQMLRAHEPLLREIGAQYGVQPQYIVALWGIETNYGRNTGGFDVINALATLAYDGRRGDFFKAELMNALKILDQGHIAPEQMKGSWAGAMGQSQFMPSSFLRFAVDYNRDGRRDIWNNKADVFASAANYLSQSGWKGNERWGRLVALPRDFPRHAEGLDRRKSLAEWQAMGVRKANGLDLPVEPGMSASIVQPDGAGNSAYMVYDNYRTIMKWNKSVYFATAVGLLADAIATY